MLDRDTGGADSDVDETNDVPLTSNTNPTSSGSPPSSKLTRTHPQVLTLTSPTKFTASEEVLFLEGDVVLRSEDVRRLVTEEEPTASWFLWFVASFAALEGFLFGYDIGVISGVLLLLRADFPTLREGDMHSQLLVSAVLFGGFVGVFFAAACADVYGRKIPIILASVLFVAGTSVATFSPVGWVWLLIVGRLIIGVAVGFSVLTVPLYIAELSPMAQRGKLVALDELAIVVGIVTSFAVNLILSYAKVEMAWRWAFGLSIVPGLGTLVGFFFLPESPRWLLSQGMLSEARDVLLKVRSNPETVSAELEEMVSSFNNFVSETTPIQMSIDFNQSYAPQPKSLLSWLKSYVVVFQQASKPLLLAVALAFFIQFTGQPTVLYYTSTVIESYAGNTTHTTPSKNTQVLALSLLPMLIKLIATALATFGLVDRFGRRRPLMVGMATMATVLVALSIFTFFKFVSVGVLLTLLSIYVAAFAIGLGPVGFVLFSELFPINVRAAGQSCSTAAFLFFNFIASAIFLSVTKVIGLGGVFVVFALVSIGGVLFVFFLLPETKDKSLEEISDLF